MSAETVKRLAADILKVGRNRIRIKEGEYARAMEALTREDVRGLIKDGAVYRMRYVGPRTKPPRKKKGRGKRKGKKYSRKGAKEGWMEKLRSQRKYLDELLDSGEVGQEDKRRVYLKIKGGAFKGKKALRTWLGENGILRGKEKVAGAEEREKAPRKPKASGARKASGREAGKRKAARKPAGKDAAKGAEAAEAVKPEAEGKK
jgi:large subunit ribosomal protein L19e